MKANELRISNWIHTNKHEQVVDVLCDSVNTKEKEGIPYVDIAPILLTEEWLVRFGFLRHREGYYHTDIDWEIAIRKGKFILFHEKMHPYYGSEIKYVHQFQNAIFALTGEELKIKES